MENFAALIAATAVLVAIPGPNVALIVATSIDRGTGHGLIAVAGTTAGVALQLLLTVFGLAALIAHTVVTLEWLRWIGVAYLLYLAWQAWLAQDNDLSGAAPVRNSARRVFWGGALIAVLNPKTLLFNSAFLPQFIDRSSSYSVETQLALCAVLFVAVVGAGDCVWACAAGRVRGYLARFGKIRNKLTAAFLVGASAALALSRR